MVDQQEVEVGSRLRSLEEDGLGVSLGESVGAGIKVGTRHLSVGLHRDHLVCPHTGEIDERQVPYGCGEADVELRFKHPARAVEEMNAKFPVARSVVDDIVVTVAVKVSSKGFRDVVAGGLPRAQGNADGRVVREYPKRRSDGERCGVVGHRTHVGVL